MRFNIISNLTSLAGLQRDVALMSAELLERGHTVQTVQFNCPQHVQEADVNLFLETVIPEVFSRARQQWVIPNPEWWLPPYHACLPKIDQLLCKTRDSFKLFAPLLPGKTTYVGFLSRDLYRPDVVREPRFLHVAGKSIVKNTDLILKAWHYISHPLTVVTSLRFGGVPAHVTIRTRIEEEELAQLYNRCQFHLCPSQYEGFGHALHEGLGCGALIITGDGPPMAEFGTPAELMLYTTVHRTLRLAEMRVINVGDLQDAVRVAMEMTPDRIQHLRLNARSRFEQGRCEFRTNLSQFMARVC